MDRCIESYMNEQIDRWINRRQSDSGINRQIDKYIKLYNKLAMDLLIDRHM